MLSGRMAIALRMSFALALAPLLPLLEAPAAAQPAASIAGTWDLTWQTRRGPSRQGFMVVKQDGSRITAQIHGKGSVKTKGSVSGQSFTLRGSRYAVPYTISGTYSGNRMTGSLKVLSVTRNFTAARR